MCCSLRGWWPPVPRAQLLECRCSVEVAPKQHPLAKAGCAVLCTLLGRIPSNEAWGAAGDNSSPGHLCFQSASAMHSCRAVVMVTGGEHSGLSCL